jgi:hypothetical protein
MKKLVLITMVLFLSFGINAQTFGLRVGYNMSGLRIDDNFSNYLDLMDIQGKMTNGVNIGLIFEKAIKPKFDAHVELNFNQKGSAYDMYANKNNHGTSGYGETNLNYLELALMAKIKFGPAYFGIGPYFGYMMNAQEIKYRANDNLVAAFEAGLVNPDIPPMTEEEALAATANALGVSKLKDGDFNDSDMNNFNRFDFGGHLSLGAQFPVGPVKLFAEARANMGFINWETWNSFDTSQPPASEFDYKRNMAFTFSIGVLFGKPAK